MTLLYMNGFEQYGTQADLSSDSLTSGVDGVISFIADGNFFGDQTMQMRGGGATNNLTFNIQSNTSKTLNIGMDWRTTQPSAGHGHFNVYDIDGHLLIRSRTNGLRRLQLLNGAGVEIMSVADLLPSGEDGNPHHISVTMTCDKTNGSFFYYFDDVLIDSATGIDTSNALSSDDIGTSVNVFANIDLDSHYAWYDNYHITNSIGPSPYNGRLDRVSILDITPDADSSVTFSPSIGIDNYANVDQISGASSDYNSSVTSGNIDLYTYSVLPAAVAYQHFRIFVYDIVNSSGQNRAQIQEIEISLTPGGADITAPGMTAVGSTEFAAASNAIANTLTGNSNNWLTDSDAFLNSWISIDTAGSHAIQEVRLWSGDSGVPIDGIERAPKDFDIQGSNDGSDWTTLARLTGVTGWVLGVAKEFSVSDPSAGDILAVQHVVRVVDDVNGNSEVILHTNTGANTNESPVITADDVEFKHGQILEYQDGISVPWTESAVNAIIAGIEVV